jgi:hypothetical protein
MIEKSAPVSAAVVAANPGKVKPGDQAKVRVDAEARTVTFSVGDGEQVALSRDIREDLIGSLSLRARAAAEAAGAAPAPAPAPSSLTTLIGQLRSDDASFEAGVATIIAAFENIDAADTPTDVMGAAAVAATAADRAIFDAVLEAASTTVAQ